MTAVYNIEIRLHLSSNYNSYLTKEMKKKSPKKTNQEPAYRNSVEEHSYALLLTVKVVVTLSTHFLPDPGQKVAQLDKGYCNKGYSEVLAL